MRRPILGRGTSPGTRGHAVRSRLFLLTLLATPAALAWDPYPTDPLGANRGVPTSPAKLPSADPRANPCALGPIPDTLDLPTAAEHALCANPKTRTAWANVKVQAAQLGGADAAYLPTLSGSVLSAHDHASSNVPTFPIFDTDFRTRYTSATASLSWLLYDFGARSAAVKQARSLLDAAQASQDAALQTVLVTTAHDYYTAVGAQGNLAAATQIEAAVGQSLAAATARVKGGVAAVTDQLQAQTAYARAVYNSAKARGDLRIALGTLALDMGESPATAFELAPVVDRPQTDADSLKSARELLDIAQREHPSVVAARAQIDAARAKVDQARSQGMPTLTFSGRANYSTQPVSPSLGSPELPAFGRDRYFGLQLDIPIFEGFTRTYQIREAEARVEVQQATLADAEMQVAQAVWQSYQTLQTAAENLTNSATLLESARQSFEASQHRYESGVGNILELLTAQTAFANAQQQRVQALTDWRIGKVQLVGSLGRLTISRESY